MENDENFIRRYTDKGSKHYRISRGVATIQTPRCQILTENGGSGLKESWIRKNDPSLLRIGRILISRRVEKCRINKQRSDEKLNH